MCLIAIFIFVNTIIVYNICIFGDTKKLKIQTYIIIIFILLYCWVRIKKNIPMVYFKLCSVQPKCTFKWHKNNDLASLLLTVEVLKWTILILYIYKFKNYHINFKYVYKNFLINIFFLIPEFFCYFVIECIFLILVPWLVCYCVLFVQKVVVCTAIVSIYKK